MSGTFDYRQPGVYFTPHDTGVTQYLGPCGPISITVETEQLSLDPRPIDDERMRAAIDAPSCVVVSGPHRMLAAWFGVPYRLKRAGRSRRSRPWRYS